MHSLFARRRALPVAAFLVAASVAMVSLESALAQQQPRDEQSSGQGLFKPPHRGPAVGGTSWTLSDVWGEPKMPKPSLDYPGYNYPPGGYDLNGPPSHSPYPN